MLTKSKAAFLLSVNKLFSLERRVYMWTFTFRDVIDDELAFKCWKHLNTLLTRKFKAKGDIPGMRVVEVHPGVGLYAELGGHGLHFHVLIASRLPVDEVRKLAIRAGFGRIHVKRCSKEKAKYLAKYLGKQQDSLRKGCRRWGMFGSFKGTLVKDIIIESELAENCRRVRQVVKAWGRSMFLSVYQLTVKYGPCSDWPTYPELQKQNQRTPSDNEFDEPWGLRKDGQKARFTTIKTFCEEMGAWYSNLIPDTVPCPF